MGRIPGPLPRLWEIDRTLSFGILLITYSLMTDINRIFPNPRHGTFSNRNRGFFWKNWEKLDFEYLKKYIFPNKLLFALTTLQGSILKY